MVIIAPPPPLADGSLPDGWVGVPDLAPVLLVALLQDDPAQTESGAAVEAVDGEDDDERHPEDTPGPGHGGGQRQHPAAGHLTRQQDGRTQHSQPLALTHMCYPFRYFRGQTKQNAGCTLYI